MFGSPVLTFPLKDPAKNWSGRPFMEKVRKKPRESVFFSPLNEITAGIRLNDVRRTAVRELKAKERKTFMLNPRFTTSEM